MKSVFTKNLKVTALILFACAVLAGTLYACILMPQQKNKKNVEDQLAEKKSSYENIKKLYQSNIEQKLRLEIESVTETENNFVIEPNTINNLTFAIGQIADQLEISSFSIVPQKDISGEDENAKWKYISEKRFFVSFQADYNQFALFLNSMERHSPVIFVDNFKISASRTDENIGDVKMGLTVFIKKNDQM